MLDAWRYACNFQPQLANDFQTGLPAILVAEDEVLWHTALRASSSCLLCMETNPKSRVMTRLMSTILQHDLLFAITGMLLAVAEDDRAATQTEKSSLTVVHLLQMFGRMSSLEVESSSFPQKGLVASFYAKNADVLLRLFHRSLLLPPLVHFLADIASARARTELMVASSSKLGRRGEASTSARTWRYRGDVGEI